MNRSADRACGTKARFDQAGARAAAARAKRERGVIVTAYRCPHGQHWHIGHPPIAQQLREITRGKNIRPRRKGKR